MNLNLGDNMTVKSGTSRACRLNHTLKTDYLGSPQAWVDLSVSLCVSLFFFLSLSIILFHLALVGQAKCKSFRASSAVQFSWLMSKHDKKHSKSHLESGARMYKSKKEHSGPEKMHKHKEFRRKPPPRPPPKRPL